MFSYRDILVITSMYSFFLGVRTDALDVPPTEMNAHTEMSHSISAHQIEKQAAAGQFAGGGAMNAHEAGHSAASESSARGRLAGT